MVATKDVTLIVNPVAGRGRARRIAQRLATRLGDGTGSLTVSYTTGPGEATALTREALRAGAHTVVSIGGDGTAHEVVNGFFDRGHSVNPDARLAFIAAGTGNDIVREFPGHETTILSEHTERIDLLRIRSTSAPADSAHERYALFHAGAGLVTEVVETANRLKARLGKLVYAGGSAVALYHHRPSRIRFAYDGGAPVTQPMALIIVANGRYAGGGMKIAPSASMHDGLLDLITLQGASRLDMLLRLLPAVYRGSHVSHPAFNLVKARTVFIDSDDPLSIQLDGELAGTTPVTIDVCPGVLPICPRR